MTVCERACLWVAFGVRVCVGVSCASCAWVAAIVDCRLLAVDCFGWIRISQVAAPRRTNVRARSAAILRRREVDRTAHDATGGETRFAFRLNAYRVAVPTVVCELETRLTSASHGTKASRRMTRATEGCE